MEQVVEMFLRENGFSRNPGVRTTWSREHLAAKTLVKMTVCDAMPGEVEEHLQKAKLPDEYQAVLAKAAIPHYKLYLSASGGEQTIVRPLTGVIDVVAQVLKS